MSNLAIIPARGGSKRLKNKNTRLLSGKPLVSYAIEAALESNCFDTVCLTTEDEQTINIGKHYQDIYIDRRPQVLASDTTNLIQVCTYLINSFIKRGEVFDTFTLLLPTCPLRTSVDIKQAIQLFQDKQAQYVLSVVPFSHPPQRAVAIRNGLATPFLGQEFMVRTQQLEPLYRHDGLTFIANVKSFLQDQTFYPKDLIPFYSDINRSVDIDNYQDLLWAEFLLKQASASSSVSRV